LSIKAVKFVEFDRKKELYKLIEPIPLAILLMLIHFYAPELNDIFKSLEEVLNIWATVIVEAFNINKGVKTERQSVNVKLLVTQELIEKTCKLMVNAAADIARQLTV
jgi:hypothetical protein